jgi:hypothetical protein
MTGTGAQALGGIAALLLVSLAPADMSIARAVEAFIVERRADLAHGPS